MKNGIDQHTKRREQYRVEKKSAREVFHIQLTSDFAVCAQSIEVYRMALSLPTNCLIYWLRARQ